MSFIMRPVRFASTGHIIEGSALPQGSGDYLSQVVSQTRSSARILTLDFIVKRVKLATRQFLLYQAWTASGNSGILVEFTAADELIIKMQDNGGSTMLQRTTTQKFRDVSAYTNFHVTIDTNKTDNTSCGITVNGSVVSSFSTTTNPGSAQDHGFLNTGKPISIFGNAANLSAYGYMARFIVQDGVAGVPTDTGEVTSDGFWQINSADDLTFGDTGFLLEGGANLVAGTDTSSNASPTTAADVTSAASIWQGSTSSFNLANDDIICTEGSKAIFTKDVFVGVVDLEFTGVGEWADALFGFSKHNLANNAGAAGGGVDGVAGISIYEHASNDTKFSDWSNTNAANGNSPTATITRGQIAGETCNLIRQANGTVIFKIGGSTVFSGSDAYTGPLRVWLGSQNDITPPLSMTTVSITAAGIAGNIFTKTGTITATNDSPTNGDDS